MSVTAFETGNKIAVKIKHGDREPTALEICTEGPHAIIGQAIDILTGHANINLHQVTKIELELNWEGQS